MSGKPESTTEASATQPGPTLLTERTLPGIFVHFLGLGTGFVLPALIYLVADHEFTRENARNALNWQVMYSGAVVTLFGFLAVGILLESAFPEVRVVQLIAMGFVLVFVVGFFGFTFAFLVNLVFALVAMGKAIFGGAWRYPLAPDVVGWLTERSADRVGWWKLLAVHALVAPTTLVYFVWTAAGGGSEDGATFFVGFFLVLGLLLTSVLTPGVLVRDMRTVSTANVSWRPSWVPYVGGPALVGVLTYLVAGLVFHSENPPGDAIYGFAGALWIAVVLYLYGRHRHVESR